MSTRHVLQEQASLFDIVCSKPALRITHGRPRGGSPCLVQEMHMVWFAGLRGVIAFICALSFPKQAGTDEESVWISVPCCDGLESHLGARIGCDL